MDSFWMSINSFLWGFLVTILAVVVTAGLFLLFSRKLLKRLFGQILRLFLSETYSRNLMEILSSSRRFTSQKIVEMALRSETDEAIQRTMGTPYPAKELDQVMFIPAQLAVMTTKESIKIDTKTEIAPWTRRPLQLDIPLLVGGFGPGPTLSDPMKMALAKGCKRVGTATNTGEGELTEKMRKEAGKLVLQYGREDWNKNPELFEQVDMIEIVAGCGATAGTPFKFPMVPRNMRQRLGLAPNEPLWIHSRVPEVDRPEDWSKLVNWLREVGEGVPVGIKLVPSQIEADLAQALEAGVDFITIDGAQGGIKESAPILQDDFGLPTIRGLVRAVRFLEENDARQKVSLIVSGGLHTPGDYLKALALGADAVALDIALLVAAVHKQITKVLPWEPLSQLIWYDGQFADRLDVEKTAKNVANLFNSSVEEMKLATTVLGKKALREVNKEDLVTLEPLAAKITNLPLAYGGSYRKAPKKIMDSPE